MKPDSFEFNKVIGAVLLASVVAMVCGFVAMGLYTGSISSEHEEHEAKRGYTVAGAEEADAPAGEAKAEEAPVDIMPLIANADLAAGEAQLKKCTTCHTFDRGGKNGVGPNQFGLVGAHFGHKDDFNYSDAIKSKHDQVWTEQALSEFLTNPKKYIPGNKMAFAGIKKPEDRANLIAYLKTLK